MPYVKFVKAFSVAENARDTKTYPEGWAGEVDDDTAEMAAEEGCIEAKAKPKAKGKAEASTADADAPPA